MPVLRGEGPLQEVLSAEKGHSRRSLIILRTLSTLIAALITLNILEHLDLALLLSEHFLLGGMLFLLFLQILEGPLLLAVRLTMLPLRPPPGSQGPPLQEALDHQILKGRLLIINILLVLIALISLSSLRSLRSFQFGIQFPEASHEEGFRPSYAQPSRPASLFQGVSGEPVVGLLNLWPLQLLR